MRIVNNHNKSVYKEDVVEYSQNPQTTRIVDLIQETGFEVEKAPMYRIVKTLQEEQ